MRILPTAALLTLALAAPASAQTGVNPPAGHVPFDAALAAGVQIYKCDGTAWTFTAPRATLLGLTGRMTHYAGPTWEARDGSKVVGAKVGEAPSPIGAIPHLLLRAKPTAPGHLGMTSYIQRLATTGGTAPAAAKCSATTAGTVAEVPYTALYTFWRSLRG